MSRYGGETTKIEYIDLERQFEIQIRLPIPRRYPIHSSCDGDSRIIRRVVNHAV